MARPRPKVRFLAFFLIWAKLRGWEVPGLHVRMCQWLEERGLDAVLLVFRGAAKSTIVAVYIAWRLYCDPKQIFLIQAADDQTARKMARDAKHVIGRHPLTRDMPNRADWAIERFSVLGNEDARNPSVAAHGVLSNVTGSRATEVIGDDCEVPKNIKTPESRLTLRQRLSDATHILVPDGRKLKIGTPHTHETIYEEAVADGAEVLRIPLFEHHVRYEEAAGMRRLPLAFPVGRDGLYVFAGREMLREGHDYEATDKAVILKAQRNGLVDIYAGCAWPSRFTRADIKRRRRDCLTTNEWDSQYQLAAKPIHQVRLDPDRLCWYAVEPQVRHANGGISMWLGKAKIVGASAYWDVAEGSLDGCDSVLSVLFTDERGNLYWHAAAELTGDIFSDQKAEKAHTQCGQARAVAERLQLPVIYVETNGIGTFVPQLLRRELAGTGCAVREVDRKSNKDAYILEALETPLSGRFLWAHVGLKATKLPRQMRDFIPGVKGQELDYLDSGAGAIKQTPIRIGKVIGDSQEKDPGAWIPESGVHEVTLEI